MTLQGHEIADVVRMGLGLCSGARGRCGQN